MGPQRLLTNLKRNWQAGSLPINPVSSSSTQGPGPPSFRYRDPLDSTPGLLGVGGKKLCGPFDISSEYVYSGQTMRHPSKGRESWSEKRGAWWSEKGHPRRSPQKEKIYIHKLVVSIHSSRVTHGSQHRFTKKD